VFPILISPFLVSPPLWQIEAVFIHRRVKFTSVGGIEMFKMEQIGLPLLEVLPVRVSAVEVYSLISQRVSVHLKSSVSLLLPLCLLPSSLCTSHPCLSPPVPLLRL
jgi:hypothetical protein